LRYALFTAALTATAVGFIPNVRVDHENRSSHGCFHADIATGRPADGEPVYVAIQNDSFAGIVTVRSDVYFQRSTDAGRTWLQEDRLVRRGQLFACYPDITVDREGNIYIVYTERLSGTSGHFYCTRSADGGETWSEPARVDDNASAVPAGWARVAVDTAGGLFSAWNDGRAGRMRIWSSVSTDRGATWRRNVRVDDDTVPADCFHADVSVQPVANRYLATSTAPYWVRPGYINSNSAFYSSADQGLTWTPGVVLDTFSGYCGQPHVVADAGHIVCDYTGSSGGNQNSTEARASTDGGATWSDPVAVTDLDTLYSSYLNGGKLAVDATGGVHACLMVCDLQQWEYETYYARSTDHGATWSAREMVNDATTGIQADPNIAADSSGYAYIVWQDGRNNRNEIWFSTNNGVGVAGPAPRSLPPVLACVPTVSTGPVRISLAASLPAPAVVSIRDATGRRVRSLILPRSLAVWDGRDAVGRPAPPGVYFVSADGSEAVRVLRVR